MDAVEVETLDVDLVHVIFAMDHAKAFRELPSLVDLIEVVNEVTCGVIFLI